MRRVPYGGPTEAAAASAGDTHGWATRAADAGRATSRELTTPPQYARRLPDGTVEVVDRSAELINQGRELGIDAIVSIGGDGTLSIAQQLHERGLNVVGVPKTIDNDVSGTSTTFGFDTAVNTAIEAIDKLHTTAESHDRVIVMELMGRYAGFIALQSGVAATADVIVIPEIPYRIEKVCEKILRRHHAGRLFSIIVAAEGAAPEGGKPSVLANSVRDTEPRLGGIAEPCGRSSGAHREGMPLVGIGPSSTGGMPTGYDRLLATRFGGAAVRAVADKRWGQMGALQPPSIVTIPISDALRDLKRVDPSHDLVTAARATGISFGD